MPIKRIPLAGPYNTRISATNTPPSTSGYVGIGIVGLMIVGQTTAASTKDARYINCFATTINDPISGEKKVYTVKRPGFGTQDTPASGKKGYQILVWSGQGTGQKRISAFDNPSTIYDSTSSLGAITGKCTGLTETFISATPTIAISSDDSTGWSYDTSAGLVKITDVDFPGNAGKTLAGTFAHIDGFACIMDTLGNLWASDLNSLLLWTATSFQQANAYPDVGVGCVRHRQYVIAFCNNHMEFYYNAGLTPFPLARAVAMTQKVGCINANSIAQISDTTFWVGSTPQGGISVFSYDSGVHRISTPEIDAILILAGASNISVTTIRNYGRSFVLVLAGATTLVYCIEEKFWFEYNSTTPLWTKCVGLSLGGTMVNYAVSNVSTSGKVYIQNHAALSFMDDGTTYTATAQLPNQDFGNNNNKFYDQIDLICDRESSTSNMTIAFSDDDYQTSTTWGTVDLSVDRPQANRLGYSRRRGWIFSHSANTPMRVEAAEIAFRQGRS